VATIIRIPLFYLNVIDENLIAIWFNWCGSFIGTISTVVPLQFVHHFYKHGSFVQMSMSDRLWFCFGVCVIYAAALIVCAVTIYLEVTDVEVVLLVWRIYFFVNASVEIGMMFWSLLLVDRQSGNDKTKTKGIKKHLMVRR
jgi:hypothetical protein